MRAIAAGSGLHGLARRRSQAGRAQQKDYQYAAKYYPHHQNNQIFHLLDSVDQTSQDYFGAGVIVATGEGETGTEGFELCMLPNIAFSTAPTALVNASICWRTCSGAALFMPGGISNKVGSTVVEISRNSATTCAPLTPFTSPLVSANNSVAAAGQFPCLHK